MWLVGKSHVCTTNLGDVVTVWHRRVGVIWTFAIQAVEAKLWLDVVNVSGHVVLCIDIVEGQGAVAANHELGC